MQRRGKKQRKTTISKTTVLLCLGCIMVGATIGATTSLLSGMPALQIADFTESSSSSIVYAKDGSFLGRYAAQGDRRTLHDLSKTGTFVQKAFLAAEDKDFYRHCGVDPSAMLRSLWNNIRHHAIISGASTITQQTVKLVLFPQQQRTLRRKAQEIILALELERKQNKQQILLEYLNKVYFGMLTGTPVYGVESAALHLFGHHANRLTVAQAAFLATMPNNPAHYSLPNHAENILMRQKWILSKMRELHFITQQQYNRAYSEPILSEVTHNQAQWAPYESVSPFIVAKVSSDAAQLIAKYKQIPFFEAQRELQRGGYKIYTTIDPILQNKMERAFQTNDFPPQITYVYHDASGTHKISHATEEAGAVILDNATGGILALGGGRDFSHNQVNHALVQRQPGSSLKPLLVYGPAIESSMITPGSVVDDIPRHYPDPNAKDGDWFPMNWDQHFHGLLTVRDALMASLNGPAIDILHQLGTYTGAQTAWRLGLSGIAKDDTQSLGLAIGGIHGGVSPLELAAAYATFPREGIYQEAVLIDRIEDQYGNIVYRHHEKGIRIFSKSTAYLITSMLQSVIQSPYGTAHALSHFIHHSDIAGKTGTTDDNKDAWFVGYTPKYTMSSWVGYDIPHPLLVDRKYHESARPILLFARVLGTNIEQQKLQFTRPANIHKVLICTKSGQLAGPLCQAQHDTETDMFIDGTEPQTMCQVHRLVLTTTHNHKTYLATELTPPNEIREQIMIKRQSKQWDKKDRPFIPKDIQMAIPEEIDPRGGYPLTIISD